MVTLKTTIQGYIFAMVCISVGLMLVANILYFKYGQPFEDFIKQELALTNLLLMIAGILLLLVLVLGYVGVLLYRPTVVCVYGVLLLVVGLGQISLGMTSFIFRSRIKEEVTQKGHDIFSEYKFSMKLVDDIQRKLRCCGFRNSSEMTEDGGRFADSCCGHVTKAGTVQQVCVYPYLYGCRDFIVGVVKYPLTVVGSVSMGTSVLEFLGVALAFYYHIVLKQEGY